MVLKGPAAERSTQSELIAPLSKQITATGRSL